MKYDIPMSKWKRFGWGLLGFFGSNVIINLAALIGLAMMEVHLLLAIPFLAAGFYLAYMFGEDREYSCTRTGVHVSMYIHAAKFSIVLGLGLMGAM